MKSAAIEENKLLISRLSTEELQQQEKNLNEQYQHLKNSGLSLNLTRGKPGSEQLGLSNHLDGILNGDYSDTSGTDLRNYGGLDGIPEAKDLFAAMLDVEQEDMLIGGNSSLSLMYFSVMVGHIFGFKGIDSAWNKLEKVSFLCPVPGYDRHFSVCETFGINMIPVKLNGDGPDMEQVENLIKSDPSIRGIWCVPRFSNPSGTTYSNNVVDRFAKLAHIASTDFRIFWDNAYALHALSDKAPVLKPLLAECKKQGTQDSVLVFGSSSKITFAGAGVAFMATGQNNLQTLRKQLGMSTIGPDKTNQMRHVKMFGDYSGLKNHMKKHAEIIRPKFKAVLDALESALGDTEIGQWTKPEGGYFISFDTLPELAQVVVELAGEAGVKLTPAGATYPYKNDPENKNIRLAPTYPSVDDIKKAIEVFIICVKLASVQQALNS